jgi:hypothetical protein
VIVFPLEVRKNVFNPLQVLCFCKIPHGPIQWAQHFSRRSQGTFNNVV